MIDNPLESLPDEWKVTATFKHSAGRDARGNPLPTTTTEVPGCLFADRSTSDPVDRSDLVSADAVLYAPTGTQVASTDSVDVPEGTYSVDGKPKNWPFGVEIPLRRA